jgi:hypothetical protein
LERVKEMKLKTWHYVVIAIAAIVFLAATGLLIPVLELMGLGCQTSRGFVLLAAPDSAVCLLG